MLLPITEEEKLIWIKRKQLIFLLKQQNRNNSVNFLDKIEDSIFEMSDDKIEKKYGMSEDIISKEIWVDCYPMYFHITEFDNALGGQLAYVFQTENNQFIERVRDEIKVFYNRINKTKVSEMTLEEKEELFWMTHPITY